MPQGRFRKLTNITGLRSWLRRRDVLESDTLDFKESIPDPDNVRKVFCAFANSGGGRIVFGVSDQKRVVGLTLSAQQLKDRVVQILGSNVFPASIRFDVLEEIRFDRNRKAVFIVEIFNSEYASKPHIFIKNDAVYIPIRKNGSCDYLKNHNEIRGAFLVEGMFYQSQSSDIKIILERIRVQPGCILNRIEESLILRFRYYLVQQAQFDQRQGLLEQELGKIIHEHCEIANLINSAVAGIAPYQQRIDTLRSKVSGHLSNFSRYYE